MKKKYTQSFIPDDDNEYDKAEEQARYNITHADEPYKSYQMEMFVPDSINPNYDSM